MRKKVLDEIRKELNRFEETNDEKHLYAVERLVSVLHENKEKTEEPEAPVKKKRSLDGLYLAEEKTQSNSIFDF